MFALLPFLLAAAPMATPAALPRVSRVATATVQIIKLEPVSADADRKSAVPVDRQYRQREAMPLVEFF